MFRFQLLERTRVIGAGLLAFVLATTCSGCADWSPLVAARVSTGYVSHQLCSALFVSGLEEGRAYREQIAPIAGVIAPALSYRVDRTRATVSADILGGAESSATYKAPWGCTRVDPAWPAPPSDVAIADWKAAAPLIGPIADETANEGAGTMGNIVVPRNEELARALARTFEEPASDTPRLTEAVVVVHAGRVIAERYAPGIGVDTPLAGWSATKSIVNALIGVLVQQGELTLEGPAPVAAWSDPRDPRHAISVEHLLRMTSGLDAGNSLESRLSTAFDPTARMIFALGDSAAFAESAQLKAAPGTLWTYSNANTQILSKIISDRAGGTRNATLAFARRELFDKLGMRHVTLEFDAAGTPIGASHAFAPARAWARFGMLYLHDGVVAGERILPAGWVDFSARQTPGSGVYGYGAGFWTNRGGGEGAQYRIAHGMPADAFMARGSNGQYVVIVPSHDLVIVRLGNAWGGRNDMEAVARLTGDVIDLLPEIDRDGSPTPLTR